MKLIYVVLLFLPFYLSSCSSYRLRKRIKEQDRVEACVKNYLEIVDKEKYSEIRYAFQQHYDSTTIGYNAIKVPDFIMFSKNNDSIFFSWNDNKYLDENYYYNFYLTLGIFDSSKKKWVFSSKDACYSVRRSNTTLDEAKLDNSMFYAEDGYLNKNCEVNYHYVKSLCNRGFGN